MKILKYFSILVNLFFISACTKIQDIIPDTTITYTIEDAGKVVFSNPRESIGHFNWDVENENYHSEEDSPYFIFLTNGLKKIKLHYIDKKGNPVNEIFEIVVKNAIEPKEKSYLKAIINGKVWDEEWFALSNGQFDSNGSSFLETAGNPTTNIWGTDSSSVKLFPDNYILLIDQSEVQSSRLALMKENYKVGKQKLAEINEKGELVNKGWNVRMVWKNGFFESAKAKNGLLEIIEIKEGQEMKFFPDMYNTHTLWVTWHFTNGLEGDNKIEFVVKNQYFLAN